MNNITHFHQNILNSQLAIINIECLGHWTFKFLLTNSFCSDEDTSVIISTIMSSLQ